MWMSVYHSYKHLEDTIKVIVTDKLYSVNLQPLMTFFKNLTFALV